MTREEKKEELIGLFAVGAIYLGDLIDECFEFGQQHPHWISVEDELPPKKSKYDILSNNVLATDGKEIYESVYNHDFGEWFTHDLWAINNITHWMPRPAPPEHIADISKMISSSELPNNQKGEQSNR